nr:immunoglobulin heavy chain junction region [Macaca mulatta]MOV49562.1 immunoglobulin heavy chain junction region [Macaca mulatta]
CVRVRWRYSQRFDYW